MSKDEMNKTREYDEPGDPNNPNRCRDGAVIRMLTLLEKRDNETRKNINGIVSAVTDVGLRTGRLEAKQAECWKELARLWEVVKFGNTPPPNPVPPSERWIEVNPPMPADQPAVCKGCGQPLKAENAWMEDGCPCNSPKGCNQPAGELREWWMVVDRRYGDVISVWPTEHCAVRSNDGAHLVVHVREVPSPERVGNALAAMARSMGMAPMQKMKELLPSLGIDTEGL